ncbi:hypothetical protein TrST_g1658 [Triparma strigata]|uniref:Alanine racemase C-terminal domain-containing protein n=1 Tax=Triparma strigata TaxID=1606541 RepID=A0A9W7AD00_9STRA|nr:hypothetical protein TrST_g1658 [Triparma strigata]
MSSSPTPVESLFNSLSPPPPPPTVHSDNIPHGQLRATHTIDLPAIGYNYSYVSSHAASQKCSVMAVVKADAYGHGSVRTAQYLQQKHGCTAFAVATLEEAITLRQGGICYPPCRVLVLGAPVGYPECFDLYLHYRVEVMMSGMETVRSFLSWAEDGNKRREAQVQHMSADTKAQSKNPNPSAQTIATSRIGSAATLSNVEGEALKGELRRIMSKKDNHVINPSGLIKEPLSIPEYTNSTNPSTLPNPPKKEKEIFRGLEHAASVSRQAAQKTTQEGTGTSSSPTPNGQKKITKEARQKRVRYHIMVDTGMGRLGFTPETDDSTDTIKDLYSAEMNERPIEFYGLCTHMAEACNESDFTLEQMERFKTLLGRVREGGIGIPTVHTDNSAALLTKRLKHFDPVILEQESYNSRGFVRCGGAVYGQRPSFPDLKECSTLSAAVGNVMLVKKGDTVGYDRTWVAKRDSLIATLGLGFADGYPRELGGGRGKVVINNVKYPIVGNVCMDMLMVDVTTSSSLRQPDPETDVKVGDEAYLWGPGTGKDGIHLKDIAEKLGTTQSALTCGIVKERVKIVYKT